MLVLAIADLERLLRGRRRRPRRCRSRRCSGTDRAFAADLIALRPQPGQAASAANLRALLAGSEIVASHRARRPARPGRLLAALRAAGRRRGARHARATPSGVADAELRSAIDNPMVLPDGRVESCGNFHGAPLGVRVRLPRDRRRRGRRDRRAAHRPAARRDPLARACRRSWPRTPASTPG